MDTLPWPEMEPLPQLAPYLNGLCISEALDSFGRLADALDSFDPCSPAPSCSSSSICSSSSSSSSSPLSSSSSSSSTNDWHDNTRPLGRKRKARNAVAAERYRRKLKGRLSCLLEEKEHEEKRNLRLRAEIESKLAIYREFVELLSENVRCDDFELAHSGLRSLSSVLSIAPSTSSSVTCCPSQAGGDNSNQANSSHSTWLAKLKNSRAKFELILIARNEKKRQFV